MSRTTFDITTTARHLAGALMDIADAEGEVDEARYDAWMGDVGLVCEEIGEKLQALRAVRVRLLSEAEVLKSESRRVASRAKQRESEAERLRGYMKELLLAHRELHGESKVSTGDGFVRLNKRTSYEVTVMDMDLISDDYLTRPEPKLNKAAVVAAHKEGWIMDGIDVAEVVNEHVMEGG